MSQSKKHSLMESIMDVMSGFVVALAVWMIIVTPIYGIEVTMTENLEITGLFTVIGIARKYIWRRLFNHYGQKQATRV